MRAVDTFCVVVAVSAGAVSAAPVAGVGGQVATRSAPVEAREAAPVAIIEERMAAAEAQSEAISVPNSELSERDAQESAPKALRRRTPRGRGGGGFWFNGCTIS